MINIKNIHNPKVDGIISLAKSIKTFNSLNDDFIKSYYTSGKIYQYILKKNCKMIFKDRNFSGLIWADSFKKPVAHVKTLYFSPDLTEKEIMLIFKAMFKSGTNIYIKTTDLDPCINILKKSGFKEILNLEEMELSLINYPIENYSKNMDNDNLYITKFREGIDEVTRVRIQNAIFRSETRIPITLYDIKVDKLQSYYLPEGNYFLKIKNKFIGYGQLIYYDNTLMLVNFGILHSHRRNQYGSFFLKQILYDAIKMGYIKISLKVKSKNKAALNLYNKMGFKKTNTLIEWKLENKH